RDRLCLWTDIPTTVKQQPMQLEVESGPEESGDLLKKRIAGRILAVEDDPLIARLLQRILEKKDYEVKTALSAEEAMEAVQGHLERFDLVLVDLNLPGEQGLDFLKRLKRMDETVVGIVITGMASSENILASLRGGAFDFIAKPFRPEIVQQSVDRALQFRRLLVENRNYALDLEAMVRLKSKDLTSALTRLQASYMFTLEAFAALVGAREQDTGQHSHRVSEIARMISEKLALPDQEIEDITRGALLHDIGKIAIPDAILLKPGPLTDAERTIMQTHAEVGYNILKSSEALCNVAELVYSHQERFDGSGYPRGLRGEEICIGARIFSVIDAYDAMRAHRVYRKSMTVEKAVEELKRGSGSQFDPEVVKAFLALLPEIEAAGQWPEGE
ncbi:MAG TPA: response regulator, partial [Kiritimatiellia bacterium]|nr:response regulator [Kiritimatiellia bacterium]HQQ05078.1 response regulator [Kiritimatiellia bacterium]